MSYKGKALMLGNAGVGKTSILTRFIDGKFLDSYIQTVGANFYIKEVDLTHIINKINLDHDTKEKIKESNFKVYWWDIGGQTDKLFVTEYYFLNAVGAIVVFDVTQKETYDNLDFWISKMKDLSGKVPFIIIGNKIDLEDERKVSFDEGKRKADENGVQYIETSAKDNKNVEIAFETLAIQILNNMKP
jgi:small GTP-binding protein